MIVAYKRAFIHTTKVVGFLALIGYKDTTGCKEYDCDRVKDFYGKSSSSISNEIVSISKKEPIKKFKVLIIEDTVLKMRDIVAALANNNIKDIDIALYRNQGLVHIKNAMNNNQPYDLIVLDMQFPIMQGCMIEEDAGLDILREMKRKSWNIPVVICSSSNQHKDDAFKYNNVVEWIIYDPFVDLTLQMQHIIDKVKKGDIL